MAPGHIGLFNTILRRWVQQSFIYNFKNREIGLVHTIRHRFTIAQVNAGATLLVALNGFGYRVVSCKMIAVGGAVGAVTTIDILGTLAAASRKLVTFAQASLTQSAVLTDGGTGTVVLADGASYVANDENTAITIGVTGAAITTATFIDVILNYTVEKQ